VFPPRPEESDYWGAVGDDLPDTLARMANLLQRIRGGTGSEFGGVGKQRLACSSDYGRGSRKRWHGIWKGLGLSTINPKSLYMQRGRHKQIGEKRR
jgi:hypothetical protein